MIVLTATTDLLEVTYAAAAAPSLAVHASYVTINGSTITPGRSSVALLTNTSGATSTIQAGPAAGQTTVKYCSIYNGGTTALAVQVKYTDGSNVIPLSPNITLGIGFTLLYMEGSDCWTVRDAQGNIQQSIGPGRWLKRTVILNGTTTFTTSSGTNSIIAKMVAGGGQGGGGAATTGFDGSGGGSGSYAEWAVAVSPSTVYTVAVGAGGSTGGTGAGGQTGGITTFAVGATTVTCNGGIGGAVGTSAAIPVLGGAGGVVSTNGTVNMAGAPGAPSYGSTALDNGSGAGGSSLLGAGGQGQANISATTGKSAATLGYGGGGGGGTTTGSVTAGGAGANGVIIVDEYS
jgi:hypothetical protein